MHKTVQLSWSPLTFWVSNPNHFHESTFAKPTHFRFDFRFWTKLRTIFRMFRSFDLLNILSWSYAIFMPRIFLKSARFELSTAWRNVPSAAYDREISGNTVLGLVSSYVQSLILHRVTCLDPSQPESPPSRYLQRCTRGYTVWWYVL